MMFALTVTLIVLAGWSATGCLRGTRTRCERLGLSIFLGMGLLTLIMFGADLVGLPIQPLIYLPVLSLPALDGLRRIIRSPDGLLARVGPAKYPAFVVPAALVTLAILLLITLRCIYLPNRLYDSLAGFDLLGRTIAAEHTFRVSLFDYADISRRGSYPPFTALTIAWGYQTGLVDATQAVILPFLAFMTWAFGFARRVMSAAAACGLLLLCLLSGDFYGYLQLPLTNLPMAAFAGMGFLYLFVALHDARADELRLSMIALALCLWTRSDAVAFAIACAVVVGVSARPPIPTRHRVLYALPSLVALLLWQLYADQALAGTGLSRFSAQPVWDPERLWVLVRLSGSLTTSITTMGLAPWALLISLVSALIIRERQFLTRVAVLVLALVGYTALFYQLDPVRQDPLEGLLASSYRRGITSFVLPMWFLALVSPAGRLTRRAAAWFFSRPS